MADATFVITLTFSDSTQALANTKRDNALLDFAKASSLDIWTDSTHTVVDSAKVAPAVRAYIYAKLKQQVVSYRAQVAAAAAEAAENALL